MGCRSKAHCPRERGRPKLRRPPPQRRRQWQNRAGGVFSDSSLNLLWVIDHRSRPRDFQRGGPPHTGGLGGRIMRLARLIFTVAAASALLGACLPVATRVPAGSTIGFKIDPVLVGTWRGVASDQDTPAYVH